MSPVALPPSRYGAPEAHLGVPPDFDGRPIDWSAVAFEAEPRPFKLAPAEDCFLRIGVILLLAAPWGYCLGVLARSMVG